MLMLIKMSWMCIKFNKKIFIYIFKFITDHSTWPESEHYGLLGDQTSSDSQCSVAVTRIRGQQVSSAPNSYHGNHSKNRKNANHRKLKGTKKQRKKEKRKKLKKKHNKPKSKFFSSYRNPRSWCDGSSDRSFMGWTHWAISRSSQCSTTGVTKAVVCVILSVGWCI